MRTAPLRHALVSLTLLALAAHCTPFDQGAEANDDSTSGGASSSGDTNTSGGASGSGALTDAGSLQDSSAEPGDDASDAGPLSDPTLGVGYGENIGTRLEAAFDGIIEQNKGAAASASLSRVPSKKNRLVREYPCDAALTRVDLYAPTDSPILTEGASGATGVLKLVGRKVGASSWESIAVEAVTPEMSVVHFEESALALATGYVAYAIEFPTAGVIQSLTARVAEVTFHGRCEEPADTFNWTTGGWSLCSAQCVNANNLGTQTRGVSCIRTRGDATFGANVKLCDEATKPEVSKECTLACNGQLVFQGYRASDATTKGLDQGNAETPPGPLPTSVSNGSTYVDISGKRCLPGAGGDIFLGSKCKDESGLYCSFTCN